MNNPLVPKIKLSSLEIKDADSIVKQANNINIWINLTDIFPSPYKKSDAIEFIKISKNIEPQTIFKISYKNKFAGIISITPKSGMYKNTGEIGYWIGEEFWGKGIVSDAIKLILDYTKKTFPEIKKVYALVFDFNKASMRVLEKNGFVEEAVLKNAAIKNEKTVNIHYFSYFLE
jgi:RimJ/RimL family protein N-acetyltransferase